MKSVTLAQSDARTVYSANALADEMAAVLYGIKQFRDSETDPREVALAVVELDSLFDTGLTLLRELRDKALDLNA